MANNQASPCACIFSITLLVFNWPVSLHHTYPLQLLWNFYRVSLAYCIQHTDLRVQLCSCHLSGWLWLAVAGPFANIFYSANLLSTYLSSYATSPETTIIFIHFEADRRDVASRRRQFSVSANAVRSYIAQVEDIASGQHQGPSFLLAQQTAADAVSLRVWHQRTHPSRGTPRTKSSNNQQYTEIMFLAFKRSYSPIISVSWFCAVHTEQAGEFGTLKMSTIPHYASCATFQRAKTRPLDRQFVVDKCTEMIVSSPTQSDGDVTTEFKNSLKKCKCSKMQECWSCCD